MKKKLVSMRKNIESVLDFKNSSQKAYHSRMKIRCNVYSWHNGRSWFNHVYRFMVQNFKYNAQDHRSSSVSVMMMRVALEAYKFCQKSRMCQSAVVSEEITRSDSLHAIVLDLVFNLTKMPTAFWKMNEARGQLASLDNTFHFRKVFLITMYQCLG